MFGADIVSILTRGTKWVYGEALPIQEPILWFFGESEEIRIYHVGIINITGFIFFCFIVIFIFVWEKKNLELQDDNNSFIKKKQSKQRWRSNPCDMQKWRENVHHGH